MSEVCKRAAVLDSLYGMKEENPPADLSDNAIIDSVLGGEREAYRHLVARHQNMIFSLLMRQTGDAVVSEELCQACFVRAFFNLRSFRKEAQFSTWLVRIALNVASSHFSSRRFREAKLTDSFDASAHDMSTHSPQDEKEKNEFLCEFRTALLSIKSYLRETLVLCGLEGKTYEEAAGILGVPVGTVRSRLNKARLLLKEKLSAEALRGV